MALNCTDGEALVLEFRECGVPLHNHYSQVHSDLEWYLSLNFI